MSYIPSTSLKTFICYVIKHFFKVIGSNKYPCNLFSSQVEQTQAMVYFLYRINIRIFFSLINCSSLIFFTYFCPIDDVLFSIRKKENNYSTYSYLSLPLR